MCYMLLFERSLCNVPLHVATVARGHLEQMYLMASIASRTKRLTVPLATCQLAALRRKSFRLFKGQWGRDSNLRRYGIADTKLATLTTRPRLLIDFPGPNLMVWYSAAGDSLRMPQASTNRRANSCVGLSLRSFQLLTNNE